MENLSDGVRILILTKYHLTKKGKTKELDTLSTIDFRRSLVSLEQLRTAQIIIYFDNRGTYFLKNIFTINKARKYIELLGFNSYIIK